ncbi:CDP-glycerol glycerophosphotransferase (TagB/SpsB family) [Neobacillus bataviensis]|uniref:CDP-glycerol glycerophosphotransferase (TagB/SpsB family) n=1 Tax=Neobacillus bataviensis TaxID=220685 RepID=A0A561CMB9_9BACI|nr:CDP-glycerol glycerophosphotransferase family protein [Neobacillus bataviensis]TWD92399.1 CDP-glycerol glycerophosphotransferase (TagB/SpsB family) [Neobacillus bataviensis]
MGVKKEKKIAFKSIAWNGTNLQLIIPQTSSINFELVKVLINKRNTTQYKEMSVEIKKDQNEIKLIIPIRQLKGLEKGRWDLFIELKDHFKARVGLYDAPIASQIMRYLKPIVNTGKFSLIPYLTSKNGLSIHCGNLLKLEDMSYNVVPLEKRVNQVQDLSSKVIIDFQEPVSSRSEETRLIMKNGDNVLQVPFQVSSNRKAITIDKKILKPLLKEQKWNLYLENIKGNIVLRYSLDYYLKANKQKLNFNKRQLEKKEDTSRVYVKGQIFADNLKVQNEYISFEMNPNDLKFANNIRFSIKKRNKPERINLNYKRVYINGKEHIEIPTDQLKEITSSSRWDLSVELFHDNVKERRRIGAYNKGNYKLQKEKITGFSPLSEGIGISPYLTNDNEFSFYFCTEEQYVNSLYPATTALQKLSVSKKGVMRLTASISLGETNDFTVDYISLRLRNNRDNIINIPCVEEAKNNGERKIKAEFNIKELGFEQFYWDIYITITAENKTKRYVRLLNDNFLINKRLKHGVFKYTFKTENNYIIYPYITNNNGLSITYRQMGEFETTKYKINEYTAYLLYITLYWYFKWNPIWLVHEKYSETAQDNGFYFFRDCYENNYDRKIYYVIRKGSPDESNVLPYKDRVVHFMSIKHLLLLLGSKLIVSSETKGHGYAWRVSTGPIRNYLDKKKYVFLQHGVLGLKRVDNTFKVNSTNGAELFVVSSDFEKNIVKNYFGYREKNIIVTGLARWDAIENTNKAATKEIFLMPTWRNWLEEVEDDQFVLSDYFQQYNSLIQSEKLSQLLSEHNVTLNFYVHPKFMPYVENFTSSHKQINVIQFGEAKINDLIMRSSLLITDYSSVAWETYYQKKPVLFFHFDIEKYMENQGSYMDLKKEIFGDVAYNSTELVDMLGEYITNDFKEKEEFSAIRENYFKYIDHNNSARIYEAIIEREDKISQSDDLLTYFKGNHFVRSFWRKYKRKPVVNRVGQLLLNRLK